MVVVRQHVHVMVVGTSTLKSVIMAKTLTAYNHTTMAAVEYDGSTYHIVYFCVVCQKNSADFTDWSVAYIAFARG